ncbi:MAG TPA: hypothetical protein V6C85_17955 [Allocoleopsis sp.]
MADETPSPQGNFRYTSPRHPVTPSPRHPVTLNQRENGATTGGLPLHLGFVRKS